jgi:GAF domain-containing protein
VVVGDPDSDPSEVELLLALGERSLLMVPVVCRGESLGLIEAYRADERAWTRAEINRARVVANQFASVIPTLVAERSPRAVIELKASAGRGTRA